jgi:tRNA-specific 2-thiouridylase
MQPMAQEREKVVVAMSGGVDSSVAACLLVEQGYDVIGLFMRVGADREAEDLRAAQVENDVSTARMHQGCCSAGDAADARFVAGKLGIPFYALDFKENFDRIIDYFANEYARGRTPNPCILCNDRLKFGKLLDYAGAAGARYIATGHYARIGQRDGRRVLMRGRDASKDQSYVLFGLERATLDRVMFPVGHLTKNEVREIARRLDLPNRDKPDSVEICFAPDRDYARVVRQRRPEGFVEGDVLDATGRVIGRHRGIAQYTIGQRRGLGIAAGQPIYVTRVDAPGNTVTVGEADALLASTLIADRANYLVDPPGACFHAQVKIRYLHRPAPATVELLDDGKVRIKFDEPQRAITPGQAVVFYDGDVVIGGAWIQRVEPPPTLPVGVSTPQRSNRG